jgi:membrane dipeptidase
LPLDISHMTEIAALTALDRFEGVVSASHANSRTLLKGAGGERHLTDQVINRLFERGGCVGVVPYNKFLSADWTSTSPRDAVTIKHIIDQIDYYCQMAGNSMHVGIGSDFDGGFGYPRIPDGIESVSDLQKIEPALREKGYSELDIENIFNKNWKRHLELILPK